MQQIAIQRYYFKNQVKRLVNVQVTMRLKPDTTVTALLSVTVTPPGTPTHPPGPRHHCSKLPYSPSTWHSLTVPVCNCTSRKYLFPLFHCNVHDGQNYI